MLVCSYVRLIITADRVVIPQDGFEQRPQFHGFVTRLLGGIVEAAAARQRREDADNGGGGAGPQPSPFADDYEGAWMRRDPQYDAGRRTGCALIGPSIVSHMLRETTVINLD